MDEANGEGDRHEAGGDPGRTGEEGNDDAEREGSDDAEREGSDDAEREGSDDADRQDPHAAAREEVVEAFARSAEVYGVSRSYGRLYGILYFADEPMSLDELVEESGYAKSTVSTAMQKLERLHMAHRSSRPGEGRKAFFEAERDFWYILREFLNQEVRREISVMTRALDAAEEYLEEAPDTEAVERDRERIEKLRTAYDRSERLVNLLSRSPVEKVLDLLGSSDGD